MAVAAAHSTPGRNARLCLSCDRCEKIRIVKRIR
jgi:hypothetical protein